MQRYNKLYYLLDCAIIGREGFEQQARELATELNIKNTPSLHYMKKVVSNMLQTIEPIRVNSNGIISQAQRTFNHKFYHLEQVAKKLGKSVYQVKELINSGKLNAVDVSDIETENCKYRVLESDLELKILKGENKMKKFQIWESDFNQNSDRGGMLILESEIYKVVDMYNQSCMVINGVSVDLADILTETIKTFNEKINDVTIMEEFLTEQGVKFTSIDWLPDLPVHQELLYFDTYNQQFDDLALCDYVDAYDWHDGSNHKTETAHDSITVTKIVTEDVKYLDLDEWDQHSNGFCTGGRQFYHEIVYRVIELDGSKVDNMYMLCEWSQWQGDHETAKILTQDELDAHLEEIGYSID